VSRICFCDLCVGFAAVVLFVLIVGSRLLLRALFVFLCHDVECDGFSTDLRNKSRETRESDAKNQMRQGKLIENVLSLPCCP
jgi:hypothetical protein